MLARAHASAWSGPGSFCWAVREASVHEQAGKGLGAVEGLDERGMRLLSNGHEVLEIILE